MSKALEAWRERLDRPTRFEGPTPAAAIKAAWKACAIGTQARFESWLLSLGLKPFSTGRGWILIVPGPEVPLHKLTARPITPDGKNTY